MSCLQIRIGAMSKMDGRSASTVWLRHLTNSSMPETRSAARRRDRTRADVLRLLPGAAED
eukprot:10638562-Alexandrium_andersonii.AAC.1